MDMCIYYAVTIWGHDGIPDGEWCYTTYLSPNEIRVKRASEFSYCGNSAAAMLAFERVLRSSKEVDWSAIQESLQALEEDPAPFRGLDLGGVEFRCPDTDDRFAPLHVMRYVRYQIEPVLRVQDLDFMGRHFALTPHPSGVKPEGA